MKTTTRTLAEVLGYAARTQLRPAAVLDAVARFARAGDLPFDLGGLAYAVALAVETGRLGMAASRAVAALKPLQVLGLLARLLTGDVLPGDVAAWLNHHAAEVAALPNRLGR
jgi:hypothetical protein